MILAEAELWKPVTEYTVPIRREKDADKLEQFLTSLRGGVVVGRFDRRDGCIARA